MPGILPMKMIRVGTTTQSRIAQACDRCRSKKIRCDGVRPCCTQCANVGFECKTSDKLSRRAFPRGYTESLEDRVRGLETEVRELKALLDEKDEKIDVLSRIHNFSPQSRKISMLPKDSLSLKAEENSPRDEVIMVEIPAAVHPTISSTGTSTTAALIEAFEEKVQESARSCPPILSSYLLQPHHITSRTSTCNSLTSISATPPRLLSDQYINIFFQEWQPLLPVLHRPTFLRVYEQYLSDSDGPSWQSNRQAVAQLFLIFEIAAHSSSSRTKPATSGYELQWRKALSGTSSTPTIVTLQSHILAQLCYLLKADYPHLLRHRAYAVSMVHQLNLHQGHKYQSLSTFEVETRKKVFWCQYVLDKFASAATGTPQLLRETDVSAEYPADVDDENLNTQGISPALPGELTKMLSALALFRVSRILGKALEVLYPSRSSYQLSLSKLHSLSDELDQWQEELPGHLRLRFCNDKPATNLVSCRSPLMSLAYFYIRSLIHRPILCYGTGNSSSAAMIVLAAAAKHELQILDLLDERSMNYTFPVNKQDLLLNAGFSILWQSVDLDEDSKLVKDNQKSLTLLLGKLTKENNAAGYEFRKIASTFVSLSSSRPSSAASNTVQVSMPAPTDTKSKSARKQLQAIASRLSSLNGRVKNVDGVRRASMSQSGMYQAGSPIARANSSVSLSSTRSAPVLQTPPSECQDSAAYLNNASAINLDYFPLQDDVLGVLSTSSSSTMLPPSKTSSINNHHLSREHVVDEMGQCSPVVFDPSSPSHSNGAIPNNGTPADWSNDLWQISPYELSISKSHVSQSLLSFSEESMTSGDDLLFSTAGSHNGSTSTNETTALTPPTPAARAEYFKSGVLTAPEEFEFQDIVA